MPQEDVNKPQAYVIVVDDHPLFASGMSSFLAQISPFVTAHTASNAEQTFELINNQGLPQLVVMDFWLAQGASVELLKQLKSLYPTIKILVVSADDDSRVIQKVKELGADGFLLKQETPDVLAKVVNHILAGKTWFTQTQQNVISSPHKLPISIEELQLTTRQGEILQLILQGFSNKQIAQKINVTEQTIKDHVSIILERLNVKNRVAVITLLQGRHIQL
jgi:DNA-binding NarL/FixJ family response regulator